ncbi:peptidoglycan DD-metalloendopeptidase family protein [Aestuariibaculum sp. YM273]|uniref:murein hydrolase activator EnvC family protein n=1 Tax=Aestuariibaculum sp. YM273 TaxID=3070659 RepID=UPI0027DC48E4|nr:peptidoglycan DD-metalloendopeptidase family protein [Aestuariibaculum sp. YM273]WMI66592.1 peptidoglycan DD-metalloendopeptidase family protein [Aestuariibaculum sp. YM273]
MNYKTSAYNLLFILALTLSSTLVLAQSNKQKELETRRQELRREIQKINQLRAENKSKEKSELSLIEGYNYKINVLDNLIKVTNQQANYLTRQINSNQKKITDLRDELKVLKEDYAAMIVKSYKSKNQQSRIMFLLSSNNFKQAYKRLQYMKQYADHQKQQGETIKLKTVELQETNTKLLAQQEEKKKLIAENKEVQRSLEVERKQHHELMKTIKSNLSLYASQIKKKQQEVDRIDAEIDRIIKAAIAKSNKKAGKPTTSSSFALTAEEKVLAASFVSNRGKLPWPVARGYVIERFGKQPSPIDKSIVVVRNGVKIATEKGADIRAVFNGEVIGIGTMKNINPFVIIKHGNYITTYTGLGKVYVKTGDKVSTKQKIGQVFTNPSNGESNFRFLISKGASVENPASWIYKM